MTKPENQVAGLHLFEVTIRYSGFMVKTSKTLFITNKNSKVSHAVAKAERFLKRNHDKYPGAVIINIKDCGTIDD